LLRFEEPLSLEKMDGMAVIVFAGLQAASRVMDGKVAPAIEM
jgi:hypothetical protein